ncbi:HNH endonuclease signature motif containing protein [Ralstonia sp. 22111]|uniref:HNH endonuclease signature motif containing protein n=1 Tax=Ralstonia sp. 22111 TaxID=3453878 RepID=UPI003F848A63
MKGIHLSPKSEFKKGRTTHNRLPVGSETIRRDKGSGASRVYRKVAEPNVWRLRAVLVWESLNGPVPKGCVVHHKDKDSMNDAPGNLECLSRAEHAREHKHDLHPT